MTDTYITNSADLALVADAIRTKIGTTDKLVFPTDFATAINTIQATPTEPYVEETISKDGLGDLTSAVLHGGIRVRSYMFYNSTKLTSVKIQSTAMAYIDRCAFKECAKLSSIYMPAGILVINTEAFCDCTSLMLNELPAGLKSIGAHAFSNCPNITISHLPSSMITMYSGAFKNCTGLTTMTFRSKVISVNDILPGDVFEGCTNLTTINVPWAEDEVANAPWGATNATINYKYTEK